MDICTCMYVYVCNVCIFRRRLRQLGRSRAADRVADRAADRAAETDSDTLMTEAAPV